jgi:hypothetical protein
MEQISWNIVLNLVHELKSKYREKFGKEPSYEFTEGTTCVNNWVLELNEPVYLEMFEPLLLNQLGTRVIFKYDRFVNIFSNGVSPLYFWTAFDGLYRECRGVVIDVKTEELILTPYNKFFNIDEFPGWFKREIEQRISIAKTVEFSNKLDGSMQSYRILPSGEFINAGSQAINPENSPRVTKGREFFFSDPAYKNMCANYPNYTFIFEFICPSIDPHIVVYSEEQQGLYLTGMRCVDDGSFKSYREVLEIADKYGVKHTDTYKLTLEDAYSALDKYKSSEREGLVINIDGFRAKLKFNDFLGIHNILSRLTSPNPVIEAVISGTYDDLISRLPEAYHYRVEEMKSDIVNKIAFIKSTIENEFKKIQKLKYSFPDMMRYITETYKSFRISGSLISYYKTGKYDINKMLIRSGNVIKMNDLTNIYNKVKLLENHD